MSKTKGIITVAVHVAESSDHGEILPRPISVEEHSFFDIPREINIHVEHDDYVECLMLIKEQMNRIQDLYKG
jgi:hypothetical protein